MASWKVVGAAVRGPDHEFSGSPCQDAFAYKLKGKRIAAAVCDGAGSARYGDEGAQALCKAVVEALGNCDYALPTDAGHCGESATRWREMMANAVEAVRAKFLARCNGGNGKAGPATLADFSSTMVAAITGPEGGLFFHIGDGAGAAMPVRGSWPDCVISRPENGEFSNETYFFTGGDWHDRLRVTPFGPSRLLALVSDGAMPFTVAERFAGLEPRFMAPVTKFLDSASKTAGKTALAATLDGERARGLNGDDKTLLWIRLQDR